MLRNKKFFGWKQIGALAAALLFGMMAVGCGADDNPANGDKKQGEGTNTPPGTSTPPAASTPAGLVGTWDTGDEETITISKNGTFESTDGGRPFQKGTVSTSGNSVTITPTHVWGAMLAGAPGINPSSWYNKSAVMAMFPNYPPEAFDELAVLRNI